MCGEMRIFHENKVMRGPSPTKGQTLSSTQSVANGKMRRDEKGDEYSFVLFLNILLITTFFLWNS
jgi:hypothetical protein